MSQLAEVLSAQKSLEECFMKKMNALEAQIQTAGPAKDTVAKVAEEFRAFRDLVIGMLGLLRRQIGECSRQLDNIETRSRRKALIIQGIAEAAGEDCTDVTLGVINTKLGLNYTKSLIKVCHRLGQANTNHQRPILSRHRVTSLDELNPLLSKYPKAQDPSVGRPESAGEKLKGTKK
ncbi:hypothetical protein HW555_012047 [Spodoptera exigua]|uniref:Uncharacterized protein n=1 Tax=Spodoptera exigua TaxID=7107 RepID=A0A835G478_SPOEX|nr:hypothetical protein HW555_012047 [Spodoptera exigua]